MEAGTVIEEKATDKDAKADLCGGSAPLIFLFCERDCPGAGIRHSTEAQEFTFTYEDSP
ncbi:MAG: hypothetical protein ACLTER_12780 [Ruminococcus sp.]